MKVLKFGGSSLASPEQLKRILEIIKRESKMNKLAIVFSAAGDSTNMLHEMIQKAQENDFTYSDVFKKFILYYKNLHKDNECNDLFFDLKKILEGIFLLREYSTKVQDLVLAYGELCTTRLLHNYFQANGLKSKLFNSTELFVTNSDFGDADIDIEESQKNFDKIQDEIENFQVLIFQGYIGANEKKEITTFGRNGSNYSASILAKILKANELHLWTDVSGLYTADPNYVEDAQFVKELSYQEANELAHFGTNLLHPKSILPVIEEEIPIRISNSFELSDHVSTLIHKNLPERSIKAISSLEDLALVNIQGLGLRGKIGFDAKLFSLLSDNDISVVMISQASSERSIGLVINRSDATKTEKLIKQSFQFEIEKKLISQISIKKDVSIVSVIGHKNDIYEQTFKALNENKIKPLIVTNTLNSKNISVAIESDSLKKAINVIHSHILGISKQINLIVFGYGNVGKALLNQIKSVKKNLETKLDLIVNVVAIVNTKGIAYYPDLGDELKFKTTKNSIDELIQFVSDNHLYNVIGIDVTNSEEIALGYSELFKNNIHVVAANKIANTLSHEYYTELHELTKGCRINFEYETNVGAGLPIIDTLNDLLLSGDEIISVKGIFSGSLSYIFNEFSNSDKKFSDVILEAKDLKLTEPDYLIDLSGIDVARKALIIARTLQRNLEMDDVIFENLVPELSNTIKLNSHFNKLKKNKLKEKHVFRYIAEITEHEVKASLQTVEKNTNIGLLKGSDAYIEIFTKRYGKNPIIIQGSGAGPEVTAAGVLNDIIKIGRRINK